MGVNVIVMFVPIPMILTLLPLGLYISFDDLLMDKENKQASGSHTAVRDQWFTKVQWTRVLRFHAYVVVVRNWLYLYIVHVTHEVNE